MASPELTCAPTTTTKCNYCLGRLFPNFMFQIYGKRHLESIGLMSNVHNLGHMWEQSQNVKLDAKRWMNATHLTTTTQGRGATCEGVQHQYLHLKEQLKHSRQERTTSAKETTMGISLER